MGDGHSLSRRALLAAAAGVAGVGAVSALGEQGAEGSITGGIMNLSQSYNVSGDLYIGPDSAKSDIDAEPGRVYMASDSQVNYYGDGNSWVKMGVGSDAESVPAVSTDETRTETIGANEYHYAGDYDGGDADARLKAAITAATEGDCIHLETAEYTDTLTIRKPLSLIGTIRSGTGTNFTGSGTLRLEERSSELKNIRITDSYTVNFSAARSVGDNIIENGSGIIVSSVEVTLTRISTGTVTFESGTSSGIVDSSTKISVTDNGSNTVGDIS